MKEIPLTKGQVALVDDEDFLTLSIYKWSAAKKKWSNAALLRDYNNKQTARF